jgi:predicted nucleotidyltransferase
VDVLEVARALVRNEFPGAVAALLAGSSARGTATRTSDLDIVVVLDGPPAPYRETLLKHETLVELFVHDVGSIHQWWAREAANRRNTLADMCAHGLILTGGERATTLQREAATFLAVGPPALTTVELERLRYALTDALDDLSDADDPGERDILAGAVLVGAAELALLSRRQWLGRGKWLVRRLRAFDGPLADRLLAAHRHAVANGDPAELITAADDIVTRVGGRLAAGYRAT